VPEQSEVFNPLVAPNLPPGQLVQEDAPAREYFPRGQIEQPAAPFVPAPVTVPA